MEGRDQRMKDGRKGERAAGMDGLKGEGDSREDQRWRVGLQKRKGGQLQSTEQWHEAQ